MTAPQLEQQQQGTALAAATAATNGAQHPPMGQQAHDPWANQLTLEDCRDVKLLRTGR